MLDYETLRELDLKYCLHPATVFDDHIAGRDPIFVEGHGPYLTDVDGKQYLDLRGGGLANCNLGYSDPEVAKAAYEQMLKLHYASSFTGQSNVPLIQLSQKIASLLPEGLSRVMVLNTGSETNEAAMKIARFLNRLEGKPEKFKIISRKHAYHGASMGTAPVTDQETIHNAASPLSPGFIAIEAPYCYRCPFGYDKDCSSCGVECARELERVILQEGPETVAAFIAEPMGQRPGVLVPPPEYWPLIREICDKYNVFLIADEVITGFGRTGKMFALEHWGVWPDMLTLSKGLATGFYPVGATVIKESIYQRLLAAGHGTGLWHGFTMSGNPVGCAVALKNIEIVEQRGLVENARLMGQHLREGLESLREFELVGDVRGLGLFAAVELVADRETRQPLPSDFLLTKGRTFDMAMERGLLLRCQPARGDLITVVPPLIITAEEIDRAVSILRDVIKQIQNSFTTRGLTVGR